MKAGRTYFKRSGITAVAPLAILMSPALRQVWGALSEQLRSETFVASLLGGAAWRGRPSRFGCAPALGHQRWVTQGHCAECSSAAPGALSHTQWFPLVSSSTPRESDPKPTPFSHPYMALPTGPSGCLCRVLPGSSAWLAVPVEPGGTLLTLPGRLEPRWLRLRAVSRLHRTC